MIDFVDAAWPHAATWYRTLESELTAPGAPAVLGSRHVRVSTVLQVARLDAATATSGGEATMDHIDVGHRLGLSARTVAQARMCVEATGYLATFTPVRFDGRTHRRLHLPGGRSR